MSRVAMIDGALSPLSEAKVGVQDRGFLYGDSVFETLRTYGGVPFALPEHMVRLARSAALVFIELPVPLDVLSNEVLAAVEAADNAESYVRVMLTRGSGELGLDPGLAVHALRVILVTELHPPPRETYENGISAITFQIHRAADATPAAGAKIGNYLTSVLAVRAAKAAGAVEALVAHGDGRIIEGATSNVFFVRDERLITPPLDTGILPGITRERVLRAAASLKIPVELDAPTRADLATVDEVFISSSIRELVAVVRIDGRVVGAGVPGPTYRRLLSEFRSQIGA